MEDQLRIEIDSHNTIVFGPFVGELGWEIFRWSGWVRWYKKFRLEKTVIACTRDSRVDLYEGVVNEVEAFRIKGDYLKYQPDCYNCSMPKVMYGEIINRLKEKYPDAYIVEPRQYGLHKRVFNPKNMDFDYTPREVNGRVINDLLSTCADNKRIPIVISSRERKDMNLRNWGNHNWKTLFDMIENSDKFFVFVTGQSPSYYKPEGRRYIYNLEDFVNDSVQTSLIGLTIEAMKKSKLTIGPQTASIILSNLLKTPTLFWGHEIRRHAERENPYNTYCRGLLDRGYSSDPIIIFREINNLIK